MKERDLMKGSRFLSNITGMFSSLSGTALLKALLPVVVLGGSVFLAILILANPPKIEKKPIERTLPVVKVMQAHPEVVQLAVKSQGTVTPQTEVNLIAEVSGRVTYVASSFKNGGYFKKGDLLIAFDPAEYDLGIVKAKAKVKEASGRLAKVKADIRLKKDTPITRAQVSEARAGLHAANASLQEAELKRQRTELYAPFDGRVKSTNANISQYVRAGQELAQVYSVGVAEVRLPISDEQLEFLDLPMQGQTDNGPYVTIFGRVANRKYQWRGRIVRTEASLDPKSRVLYAVVQVKNPNQASSGLPPLSVGMYVNANIQGRKYRDIYVLPRKSVKQGKRVMVVDESQRLHFRDVDLLRDERDRMLVKKGLKPGENVVISPLETPIENMEVKVIGQNNNTYNNFEN